MATEWRNARGKSKWQPTLASGERLWHVIKLHRRVGVDWRYPGMRNDDPVLCSTYRSAERIERREQKRRDRRAHDETYREVRRG